MDCTYYNLFAGFFQWGIRIITRLSSYSLCVLRGEERGGTLDISVPAWYRFTQSALFPDSVSVPRAEPIFERAELFGGQGTINVNSWAPDSRRLAFVQYLPKERPLP